MANFTTNEMIEIETPSMRHSNIQEYHEFTPDFRKFIHELSQLEEELFRTDTSTHEYDYGKIIVNRVYFAWLINYLTKKIRSYFVIQTEADQHSLFTLDQAMIPEAIVLPIHLIDIMIKSIQCYQAYKTNILRIPMVNSNVQVSSPRYSTANAITYKHVYIPFEYDLIPDPGILTHLLHLIRNRNILLCREENKLHNAVQFLLTGEIDDTELQVTDPNTNIEHIFDRLMFHVFLDDLPDCTPAQLAHSIDNVTPDFFPPISRFSEYNPLNIHSHKRNFDTLPPREWFTANRIQLQRSQIPPPNYQMLGINPLFKFPFNQLIEKELVQANTRIDTRSDLPVRKSTKFWLEVFSTP
jgi:hypothetical protein